jgi:methyl-accepting chemotaxis protein
MTPEWMEFINQSIASHDRQIGELVESQADNAKLIADNAKLIADNAKLIGDNAKLIGDNARQLSENARDIGELKESVIILRDGIIAMDRHVSAVVNTVGKLALILDRHETRIQDLEGQAH